MMWLSCLLTTRVVEWPISLRTCPTSWEPLPTWMEPNPCGPWLRMRRSIASAWSGADYQPDKDDMGIEDHTIYLINELGQYEILNEDLSGLEEAEEIKEVPTELDAIVQHIQVLCQEQEIPPVPQPWLPPIKERIALEELEEVQPTVAWGQEKPLSVLLGMLRVSESLFLP